MIRSALFSFLFIYAFNGYSIDFLTRSNLADNEWYQLSISQDGVYKIDYTMLKSMGFNMNTLNPKKIHLHGYGGLIPQKIANRKYDDLPELAISVIGEEDGVFNSTDYILFYGQGPDTWEKEFIKNIYSTKSYYFITTNQNDGKRIVQNAQVSSFDVSFNQYDYKYRHEQDLESPCGIGREWFGERIVAQATKSFKFNVNGIVPNETINYSASILGKSLQETQVQFSINKSNTLSNDIPAGVASPGAENYATTAYFASSINSNLVKDSILDFSVFYSCTADRGIAYLQYIEFMFKRRLESYGTCTPFSVSNAKDFQTVQYVFPSKESESVVWNIDTFDLITSYKLNPIQKGYEIRAEGSKQNFILFNPSNAFIPVFEKKIQNQNLHSLKSTNLVIITHSTFKNASDKLANFRISNDNLSAQVIDVEDIYREFGSGKQDISAIRNCLKMLYNRGSSSQDSLKYVVLMGATSIDYQNRFFFNTNFIPTYQTLRNTLNEINSYSSDDFYGLLDDHEGEWTEIKEFNESYENLEIAIGRIPCKTNEEAMSVVNKLIHYSSSISSRGDWQNNVMMVADYGDNNTHLNDAQILASTLSSHTSSKNIQKVYIAAYPLVVGVQGRNSIMVNSLIDNAFTKGCLLVNYSGHGSEYALSGARAITLASIQRMKNINRLSFIVAATCEFGKIDNPEKMSGALEGLLNPNGGFIGGLVASRPMYQNFNRIMATAFYDNLFVKENGKWPRIGDVYKKSKNQTVDRSFFYNRAYYILGDPSLQLLYPKDTIIISQLNSRTDSLSKDTARALSKLRFKGSIKDNNGLKNANFNGTLVFKLLDKPSVVSTLLNPVTTFLNEEVVLYAGKSSIINGDFETEFVLPKGMAYNFGNGRIALFAIDSTNKNEAQGSLSLIVGGIDTSAIDKNPPSIDLFINSNSFKNGDAIPAESTLLINLFDENGINQSNGVGQEMIAWIDYDTKNLISLNQYYYPVKNTYQKGVIKMPIIGLSPGVHTIYVKINDSFGNSTTQSVRFIIEEKGGFVIQEFILPNPLSTDSKLSIKHNHTNEEIEVLLQISNSQGVNLIEQTNVFKNASEKIEIPLPIDEPRLPRGLYYYTIKIKSKFDKNQLIKRGKVVID